MESEKKKKKKQTNKRERGEKEKVIAKIEEFLIWMIIDEPVVW